ncbi:hypothetical protein KAR34_12525 [bacterium]|nr:hypothetical protein [bacterium]
MPATSQPTSVIIIRRDGLPGSSKKLNQEAKDGRRSEKAGGSVPVRSYFGVCEWERAGLREAGAAFAGEV